MDSKDIFSTFSLITNVGTPFLLGIAVGYFVKKMLRTALFLGGGMVVMLFIAEYYGVVHITDTELLHATDVAAEAAENSSSFLLESLSRLTVQGVNAAGGFIFGFKMGWVLNKKRQLPWHLSLHNTTAHDAENQLIEELRKMENDALHSWADKASEKSCTHFREENPKHHGDGKKKSGGIPLSEKSR